MTTPLPNPALQPPGRPPVALACTLAPLLLLALALPLILANSTLSLSSLDRALYDQQTFHLPTITTFADTWPHLDLRNYPAATTPAYHLTLATLDLLLTPGVRQLRILALLPSLALAALLAFTLARLLHTRHTPASLTTLTLALAAPALTSVYTLTSAAWLLPDNAGWLFALTVLSLLLLRPPTLPTLLAASIALALLVLTRQIHLWAAGLLPLASLLHAPHTTGNRTTARTAAPSPQLKHLALATLPALLATLPALLALAAFALHWQGLVPPPFQPGGLHPITGDPAPTNTGLSLAFPVMTLALVALYAPFFLLATLAQLARTLARSPRRSLLIILVPTLITAALAALPHTLTDTATGRTGGIWSLAATLDSKLPALPLRSPTMIALAALGSAQLAALALLTPWRTATLLATALAGLMASHTFTSNSYQRYSETFVLIALALATAAALAAHPSAKPDGPRASLALGPALLAAALLAAPFLV